MIEAADGYRVLFTLPELDSLFADKVVLLADRRDGKQPKRPTELRIHESRSGYLSFHYRHRLSNLRLRAKVKWSHWSQALQKSEGERSRLGEMQRDHL